MGKMSDAYKKSLNAWARGDVEGMFADYADDIVWYPNRSMNPIRGKATMREFMAKFAKGMSDISYEQTHMVESGNLLFVEGTENYTKKGKRICVPYAGVVEFRDGKFVAWRDYFDLKSLEAALAA